MKMSSAMVIGLAAGLAGCAMNSGIVTISPNTFAVSRQAATGFAGMGTLRAQALREAAAHCANLKGTMRIIKETQAEPPFVLGNYPRVDLTFACD